ncbi:helix-turn-helix domain-containing protein [Sphingomonas bacterium]|uniref:helix-turn-helix domain-containing protein n=1 Tax=Sphingomonas bacterium TaxID=1895847 RepID=UPI001575AF44|nr:helix-turn-helix transcriptional regulator [Sphingomonas bacterium]
MLTAIRAVRRARGLTLDDVARRCVPPSTAQTVSRLETGMRTVSIAWINRLANAMDVSTADLVTLPQGADLPVAAVLGVDGARAPRHPLSVIAPAAPPGAVAVTVTGGVGDYRAGDELWCLPLAPDRYAEALDRDVLVPLPAGRFLWGRLVAQEDGHLHVLPPGPGGQRRTVADPPWIARAVRLVRML